MSRDSSAEGFNGLPNLRARLWDVEDAVADIRPSLSWSPPVAQATWVIPHDFGRHPAVTVTLPDGEAIGCKVQHLSLDTLSIAFATATSGTATLT